MNSEDKYKKIKNLISNNSLPELKKFFEEYSILSEDYNNFDELLIYTIESNASDKILEYIINVRTDKNLNIIFEYDGERKIPLFEAVRKNDFDKANMLLKYKADINFLNYKDFCSFEYGIYANLIARNSLTNWNLKYILNNGYEFDLDLVGFSILNNQ